MQINKCSKSFQKSFMRDVLSVADMCCQPDLEVLEFLVTPCIKTSQGHKKCLSSDRQPTTKWASRPAVWPLENCSSSACWIFRSVYIRFRIRKTVQGISFRCSRDTKEACRLGGLFCRRQVLRSAPPLPRRQAPPCRPARFQSGFLNWQFPDGIWSLTLLHARHFLEREVEQIKGFRIVF